jgi:hypothetical protein
MAEIHTQSLIFEQLLYNYNQRNAVYLRRMIYIQSSRACVYFSHFEVLERSQIRENDSHNYEAMPYLMAMPTEVIFPWIIPLRASNCVNIQPTQVGCSQQKDPVH